MTTGTIILSLFALALGAFGGFAIGRITALHPRDPQTDQEHAQLVNLKAMELNTAMHNARAVGLNPAVKVAPLDTDLPPSSRPFIATVQRIIGQDIATNLVTADTAGQIAARSAGAGLPPHLQTLEIDHRGERVFSKFFAEAGSDGWLEVTRYVNDNNWWFKIIDDPERGIAKAKTPLSQMPRTREEAYDVR